MKGLEKIALATKIEKVSLYYSFETDTVYSETGENRYYVTDLIRENTPHDIETCVETWKNL